MRRLRFWPIYLIVLPVLVVVSLAVEDLAIIWINSLPGRVPRPVWVGVAINTVPALASGFLIIFSVGTVILRRKRDASPAPHFIRAAPLYAFAGALGAYIAYWRNNGDWNLVAQLFEWPFVATLGGALGDVTAVQAQSMHAKRP